MAFFLFYNYWCVANLYYFGLFHSLLEAVKNMTRKGTQNRQKECELKRKAEHENLLKEKDKGNCETF